MLPEGATFLPVSVPLRLPEGEPFPREPPASALFPRATLLQSSCSARPSNSRRQQTKWRAPSPESRRASLLAKLALRLRGAGLTTAVLRLPTLALGLQSDPSWPAHVPLAESPRLSVNHILAAGE